MSYSERKKYRAKKKAKKYLKRAYLFDTIVVIAALNIFGSYISIFVSLPYFICSLLASIVVIALSYRAASYYESIANEIMKPCASKRKSKAIKNNIIRVDFAKKRIEYNDDYYNENIRIQS